ncbi:MAG: PilZ domain-containing protein [Methylococcaceae bacterium]|nr:PilZ domain-containing protein [Methylococcaceae bacterium]
MVSAERRQSPRIKPSGLKATIYLEPSHDPASMEGEVLDISYTGIKIRLNTPITNNIDGKIKIQIFLPDSGIPLSITGILKHQNSQSEIGMHYVQGPKVYEMDRFMFECTKLVKS